MEHIMRLQKIPFNLLKTGEKNIELRLNDVKRKKIQIGDTIVFRLCNSDDEIKATVCALHHAEAFSDLLNKLSLYNCGLGRMNDVNEAVEYMRNYYSIEQEKTYGVIGIEFSDIYYATMWIHDDSPVIKYITGEKWRRMYNFDLDKRDFFTITTDNFVINITGGSVKLYSCKTGLPIKTIKGFNYLYTGDVKPDETELMALENGKHFYIFSLSSFEQIKRVTLPRGYESIDVCGRYSEDGKLLYIPVYKYIDNKGYEYKLCKYDATTYSLIEAISICKENYWQWHW